MAAAPGLHWPAVLVKVESKPFAAGAMRECFAMKKLSTFTHSTDWTKAQNTVGREGRRMDTA